MKRFLIYALLAVLVPGCLEYHEKMKLNSDGSGEVTFAIGISESLFNMAGDKGDLKDFNESKIRENYSDKQGIKYLAGRTYSEDGNRWIEIKLAFKSIDALNKANSDSLQRGMLGIISLKEDSNGNMVFERKLNSKNGSSPSDSASALFGNGMMEMMFGKYKWRYELLLPGKIISSNSQESNLDPFNDRVKWTVSMASLSAARNMTVVYEKKPSYNLSMILLLALGVIVLGLIFMFRIKKKKILPAGEK
jgi:hypothetical protein